MSVQTIQQYHTEVERLIQYGGSRNESSIRSAFQRLLESYASGKNLVLVPELEYKTNLNTTVKPDGTLKNAVRQDLGYWESKDERDSLDDEIQNKFAKGYPKTNILFEDSHTVVLIQDSKEVARTLTTDYHALHTLLSRFVDYEPAYVKSFRDAVSKFQADLPDLLSELRSVIESQAQTNTAFREQRDKLLELAQKAINPHLTTADIREMVIQHILTEDIFMNVFNESQFHRENNIARELHHVTDTFFTGALRRNTLAKIEPYYAVIRAAAQGIADHHEKQQFLKVIYENFYKAYNPKGADRLGIVYTPNEIVRFMIESTDYLLHKHFGKLLGDKDVNILDPATGTGTFITEIIEYLPRHQLEHKYKNELFCNEVALLPYYTANLNIEYTYQQKMGEYVEFENIAFVDTLDNLNYVGSTGQFSMFELTAENLERIKRQNEQKISVVIGNPPYNALQMNENENNKNRPYPMVDQRVKETYVKQSSAQNKTKLYDMYSRFLRWASDRIGDKGVITFVTNSSFINKPIFDGFRKVVQEEFNDIYIVDLGGDVRDNPKLSGTKNNVFGIQAGVALLFLVRTENGKGICRINYVCRPEYDTAWDKIRWLSESRLHSINFKNIKPSSDFDWIRIDKTNWKNNLQIASKETKSATNESEVDANFRIFSLGINTNRDEWVYDFDSDSLLKKVRHFLDIYNLDVNKLKHVATKSNVDDLVNYKIKWSSSLKQHLLQGRQLVFQSGRIFSTMYRPFVKMFLYYGEGIIHRQAQFSTIFPKSESQNLLIVVRQGQRTEFCTLATDCIADINFFTPDPAQCLPLYRYDDQGNRLENITNQWC